MENSVAVVAERKGTFGISAERAGYEAPTISTKVR